MFERTWIAYKNDCQTEVVRQVEAHRLRHRGRDREACLDFTGPDGVRRVVPMTDVRFLPQAEWPVPPPCIGPRRAEPDGRPSAPPDGLTRRDISDEQWREYRFGGTVHRIDSPVFLFTRPGGTTHRVVDAEGLVHCVPAPGERGCVLVWKPKDPANPVAF